MYKTKCKADGSCIDRIDSQAETINKLHQRNAEKTDALLKASNRIVELQRENDKLKAEKRDLTDALNKASRPMYNPREDANWDSRPMVERINNGEADGDEL